VTVSTETTAPTALAFDQLAADYDSVFTLSAIGKSQREVVWNRLLRVFSSGGHILELNCGTGVDALFMMNAGMNVTACDASPRMIEIARHRIAIANTESSAEFFAMPTEDLDKLPETCCFDGLFSNFAGLNCVCDLRTFAKQAARRLKPGAPLLLCFLTRFCLWEIIYYMLRGNPRKALRRCGGISSARVGGVSFPVYYRTLSELRRAFAPEFQLVATEGVGITVPPSYIEPWIASHPQLLRWMGAIDDLVRTWPGLRVVGDHMLVHLEKVGTC
jgi:ubiquinone/menaquinone biosynthesis C-methylase UbiE